MPSLLIFLFGVNCPFSLFFELFIAAVETFNPEAGHMIVPRKSVLGHYKGTSSIVCFLANSEDCQTELSSAKKLGNL